MFEKEAEEYITHNDWFEFSANVDKIGNAIRTKMERAYIAGAEFGYNKGKNEAKEIIKKLYAVYYDPCVTESDLKYRDELFAEIKQFIKESEVEK